MPYARPTLTQLRQMALQDLASADLPGVDGFLRNAVLSVLSWAIAGMAYLHYGYQDYIGKQSVPWTATDEAAAGWGALKNVQRKAAVPAVLTATFPGGVPTTPVPAGTQAATRSGVAYATTAEVDVDGSGVATVTLQAAVAGAAGNAAAGTTLSLVNGISGVGGTGVVTGTVTTGADIETPDAFKGRYLLAYASPPAGGAASDYVEWAEAVAGVTQAWCNPLGAGAGTVVVYTMWDVANASYGGFPQGTNGVAAAETRYTPATGDQLTVANAIYGAGAPTGPRPVTALVYSCAPIGQAANFVLADMVPNTSAILAAIEAALTDQFLAIRTPLGMSVEQSDWNKALDSVVGLNRYRVVSPVGPVAVPVGSIPVLGTVTPGS